MINLYEIRKVITAAAASGVLPSGIYDSRRVHRSFSIRVTLSDNQEKFLQQTISAIKQMIVLEPGLDTKVNGGKISIY